MKTIIKCNRRIRAGTGGWKHHFFVPIYLKCIKKFALKKWKLEIINISKSEAGGFKEVIFSVNGNDIYSYLNMVRRTSCPKNT